jgi:ribonuclease D
MLALKDIILAKLFAKKLLEPFLLKNLQIQNKNYTRDPEDKYRKINGYSRLRDDKKAVFRRVFDIRDKYAKLYNMPPHNVIHKEDLIKIVKDAKYINEIRITKRVGTDLIQDILHELRTAIRSG